MFLFTAFTISFLTKNHCEPFMLKDVLILKMHREDCEAPGGALILFILFKGLVITENILLYDYIMI